MARRPLQGKLRVSTRLALSGEAKCVHSALTRGDAGSSLAIYDRYFLSLLAQLKDA
jgi:hypothetical protein